MANVHPHWYPLPAAALHLTTSDGTTFKFTILFRPEPYPMVLAPIHVYHVERIYTRDPAQLETRIVASDQRLGWDFRTNVHNARNIFLTRETLEIVWPNDVTVTICAVQNVRAVIFLFEDTPQRYGSYMLSWARGR
jgi:hypothetical protein